MRRAVLVLFACGLSSCVYTHTIKPLTRDFHDTPVVETTAAGDTKRFDYSYVRLLWSSNALGEIARQAGFDEIYYADEETLSILGIWTQRWARVYGRRRAVDPEADGG